MNVVIILASGSGERFGSDIPKQFIKIAGKTILEHTVNIFEKNKNVDKIIVVSHPNYVSFVEDLVIKNEFNKIYKVIAGGKTRQESSYLGILACPENTKNILYHDAVRPFLSQKVLNGVFVDLKKYTAIDVVISNSDTIVKCIDNKIVDIPKRSELFRGQTPQAFRYDLIKKAHELAIKENKFTFTDDCGLVLNYNLSDVHTVIGDENNMKITYGSDLIIADRLFQMNNINIEDISNDYISFFKNKVGVVFGGSSGIGKSIIDLLIENNCKVYSYSLSGGVDITIPEQVVSSLNNINDNIDYVICTAGILLKKPLKNMSYIEIKKQLDVNIYGSIVVAKESLPFLRKSKGTLILFGSSSYTRGRANYSLYSSTKAAIVNFMQAFSEEAILDGVKVNVVSPERANTPMRLKNFGKEDLSTLLDPKKCAIETLKLISLDLTGQVLDVKK